MTESPGERESAPPCYVRSDDSVAAPKCLELLLLLFVCLFVCFHGVRSTCPFRSPQWGAADAEIKVPSGENTELKRSPFKAWSRLVYSYTCYAYCQGFLTCLFLPFRSIHLHFFLTLSQFFSVPV